MIHAAVAYTGHLCEGERRTTRRNMQVRKQKAKESLGGHLERHERKKERMMNILVMFCLLHSVYVFTEIICLSDAERG